MASGAAVNNDWNTAKVVLSVYEGGELGGPVQAQAELSPRQARRIAQSLLKAADDAEDQAIQNAKRDENERAI